MKEKRNEGGFTLIELLIVIIILAILAAIVVFAVGTTTGNAKAAACNSDAKTVEVAMEAYKAQNGAYPPVATAQTALTTANTVGGPWLRQWPVATVTTNGYAITADATTAGQVDVTTVTGPPANTANFDAGGQALCSAL